MEADDGPAGLGKLTSLPSRTEVAVWPAGWKAALFSAETTAQYCSADR